MVDESQGLGPRAAEGGPGTPSLDTNPSNRTSGASVVAKPGKWSEQQCKIRRVALDRLRYWQTHGYEVLWVTLTSGVGERARPIREDYKELRKRICRKWGYSPFEYVCIETGEGNGVLHMLWALKAEKGKFYVPYNWLSDEWKKITGAFSVWVARVSNGDSDRRRLSRYIVSQYCGGQDALIRLSQSRMGIPFAKMRKALLGAMKACTARFDLYGTIQVKGEALGRLCGSLYWHTFRRAWDELVVWGECEFFSERRVWFIGELQEV